MTPSIRSIAHPTPVPAASWRDYSALARPKLAILSLLVVVLCYAFAGPIDGSWTGLLALTLGSTLALCAGSVFNQIVERDADALMRRTANRPLPAGRLSPATATVFGALLAVAGVGLVATVSPLAALCAVAGLVIYGLIYTPMKKRNSVATIVGAVPGAVPALMGFAAARQQLDLDAWVLFMVLFLWQLPHFLAIAWMYRADYERAGFRMLPAEDPSGLMMGRQLIGYTLALIPVSLAPVVLGQAGGIYLVGAIVAGLYYLAYSWRLARDRSSTAARQLLRASVVYLPVLMSLLVLDRP